MNTVENHARQTSRSLIASLVLLVMIYLSTPYLALMSPNGILDAFSSAAIIVALCHFLLVFPSIIAVFAASVVTLSVIIFNIANGLYFELQQNFLSIHTLYLAAETFTYLKALPTWQLSAGFMASTVLLLILIVISQIARPPTIRARMIAVSMMLALSVGLQVCYAKINVEENVKKGDKAPLGYMVRSTGYVPFIEFNVEIAAMRARMALVNRLSADSSLDLPEKYSAAKLGRLLGYGSDYEQTINDPKYPLYKTASHQSLTKDLETSQKMNVLLLVLESVRASEMGAYGAEQSATPFLDSLAHENAFAEKFYATSNFTVKSEHAIHCSSLDFMIGKPLSNRRLPVKSLCMPHLMREQGYQTFWFHGNTKEFYGRGEYLPKLGFDKILSRDELDPTGKKPVLGWGLSDPQVLDFALNELESVDKPFYAEIMTVSNHMPFDYDWGIEFPPYLQATATMHDLYRRGIYYTDQAVKEFHERFLQSPLSKNTILVITGDHGIWTFGSEALSELGKNERFFRVPLIISTPDKLNVSISEVASHLDIAPTLSRLLNLSVSEDFMGQDILRGNPDRLSRVAYLMTEQALSYRYADLACIPSVQCQGGSNCYRQQGDEVPTTSCYTVRPSQDLLLDDQARLVDRSSLEISTDRALFDYSQIALELGSSPIQEQPTLGAAELR